MSFNPDFLLNLAKQILPVKILLTVFIVISDAAIKHSKSLLLFTHLRKLIDLTLFIVSVPVLFAVHYDTLL